MNKRDLGPAKQPTGMINMNQAQEMQKIYVSKQYEAINQMLEDQFGPDLVDTREVVFSFHELYGYLQNIADNLIEVPLENIGVRVYLGGKMENSSGTEVPNTTVFLVAAVKAGGDTYDNEPSAGMLNYGQAGRPPYNLEPQ